MHLHITNFPQVENDPTHITFVQNGESALNIFAEGKKGESAPWNGCFTVSFKPGESKTTTFLLRTK